MDKQAEILRQIPAVSSEELEIPSTTTPAAVTKVVTVAEMDSYGRRLF